MKESMDSIFKKIIASFGEPILLEKTGEWVWNNGEYKIPGAFWPLWKSRKKLFKKHGFATFLDPSTGKYEIIFKSLDKEINFSRVIEELKRDIESGL